MSKLIYYPDINLCEGLSNFVSNYENIFQNDGEDKSIDFENKKHQKVSLDALKYKYYIELVVEARNFIYALIKNIYDGVDVNESNC